jgi:hypothetical protein
LVNFFMLDRKIVFEEVKWLPKATEHVSDRTHTRFSSSDSSYHPHHPPTPVFFSFSSCHVL